MKLGAMTKEEAMQKYIDLVTTLLPDWQSRIPQDDASQRVGVFMVTLTVTMLQPPFCSTVHF